MQPYVLSCIMEGYRRQQETENIRTAQLAIWIGAVNRSYIGKGAKPIRRVNQLMKVDMPRRKSGLDRIKTVEDYNATMAALKNKIRSAGYKI